MTMGILNVDWVLDVQAQGEMVTTLSLSRQYGRHRVQNEIDTDNCPVGQQSGTSYLFALPKAQLPMRVSDTPREARAEDR